MEGIAWPTERSDSPVGKYAAKNKAGAEAREAHEKLFLGHRTLHADVPAIRIGCRVAPTEPATRNALELSDDRQASARAVP
jgi:hypothetical protein